jgi:hypothetical protein
VVLPPVLEVDLPIANCRLRFADLNSWKTTFQSAIGNEQSKMMFVAVLKFLKWTTDIVL